MGKYLVLLGPKAEPVPEKEELLPLLAKQPRISDRGELIIPMDAPMQYRWWAGGQSIAETLAELDVSAEVWGRYVDRPFPEAH